MGLIWELLKAFTNGISEGNKTTNEKEMDNYGLEDWQKDLVRKGTYDPYNFDESEELEEDDYYSEDD